MFTDARAVATGSRVAVDICVIGAGAAGITLGREFDGGSTRVALLESGGLEYEPETQALYGGEVSGLPYFPLDTPRLRFFGGTTNHWAGVCRPFDQVDFETIDWIPYSGWPVGRSEMDPYVVRAQEIVHLTSSSWDTQHWAELDDAEPLPLEGGRVLTRVDQIVPPDQRRFAAVYGDELRSSDNVTVFLHANVTEIGLDASGSTVTELSVATLSGNRFAVVPRVVVLAVGGIDNPRLLLASRSRFPNGIGNAHDLVGRFFLEHPRFLAGVLAPSDPNLSISFYREHAVEGTIIHPRLALSRETQADERISDVQVRLDPLLAPAWEQAIGSPDIATLKALRSALRGDGSGNIGRDLASVLSDLMTWHEMTVPGAPFPIPYPEVVGELLRSTPADRQALIPGLLGDVAAYLYAEIAEGIPLDGILLTARLDPVPNPDSRVRLIDQQDELGVPMTDLDWRLSPADRHSVGRTMEILGAEFGAAGLGRLKLVFDEDAEEWPADLAGGFHLMGTTRMHGDPRRGVVDRNLRVHGVSNLYIAGSSVFPTAGSGNPTMMIVALALRLAERLRGTS
ncbi:MAG: GMC family oxidoreductase [Actinomycetota bacterium]